MKRFCGFLTVVVLAIGCSDDPVEQEAAISAMSRNVYVGSDIERILLASTPTELVAAVELTYQEIIAADFPERAQALAADSK